MIKLLILIFSSLFFLIGCSPFGGEDKTIKTIADGLSPKTLYNEAEDMVDAGSIDQAIKQYQVIMASYPGSKYAIQARLDVSYNLYKRKKYNRAIIELNQFIEKGIKGPIDLLDTGLSMRTYGYISDVVIMLLNILIKSDHPVYNVGGRSVISIQDLAKKISKEMSVAIKIPHSESTLKGAPQFVGLNLSRIEGEYGIDEYIEIEQGLKNTIEWIKNYE